MLFRTAAIRYLAETKKLRSPHTYKSYTKALRSVVVAFGDRDCGKITQGHVERYVDERYEAGVRRGILYELGRFRAVLKWARVFSSFPTPRKLYGMPKKEGHVPTDSDAALIYTHADKEVKLAISLALYAGLRHEEVFRVRPDHIDLEKGIITITPDIRKTQRLHVLPICAQLSTLIEGCGHKCPQITSKQCESRLYALSRSLEGSGLDHHWRGLQPARRLLVTWGGEARYAGIMHLITGHVPPGMEWKYTHAQGHMDLKREIIEAVERRILVAIDCLTDNQHQTETQDNTGNEAMSGGISRAASPHYESRSATQAPRCAPKLGVNHGSWL